MVTVVSDTAFVAVAAAAVSLEPASTSDSYRMRPGVSYVQQDPCAMSPCRNGGVCHVVGTSFTCQCPVGYSGEHALAIPPLQQQSCTWHPAAVAWKTAKTRWKRNAGNSWHLQLCAVSQTTMWIGEMLPCPKASCTAIMQCLAGTVSLEVADSLCCFMMQVEPASCAYCHYKLPAWCIELQNELESGCACP